METNPKVYLSYAREDGHVVRELYDRLSRAGFRPWMDQQDILPGQDWRRSIQKAIRDSDFFLVCLSRNSTTKRGFLQQEIRSAIDIMEEKLADDIYLIPVRLEKCEVPQALSRYQWLDLFGEQKEIAWKRLEDAVRTGMARRGVRTEELESLYNVHNISDLLINCLSTEDLRRLSYELPPYRAVFDELSREASKTIIAQRLLDRAVSGDQVESLLEWVKEHHPSAYEEYKPYFSSSYTETKADRSTLPHRLLKNPYVVGNPIQPENLNVFLGRFDIARSIISEIGKDAQKPSLLLYGRRRMGKTSALLNISSLIKDSTLIQVYISGQSVKFHSNVNFSFHLVKQICGALQSGGIEIDEFEREEFLSRRSYVQNPILRMSEFFDEYHKFMEKRGLYCLISIDEYEEIDRHMDNAHVNEHAKTITRELLLELRDTLQHRYRIMFLFAGTHYMRDLSNVNWSEIFINVKTLHISFLSREDGYRLLTEPAPRVRYKKEVMIENILELTGCQPFLLQAVASEIISILNFKSVDTVTQDILDAAIQEVLEKHNTYFDYLWDTECSSDRHRDLLKIICANNRGIDEGDVTDHKDELRDLVRKEVLHITDGRVKLTMPIVKQWMKKNQHLL